MAKTSRAGRPAGSPTSMAVSSRSATALTLLALLGLGASVSSSVVHYRLVTDSSYVSFCDVTSTVSCTEAYLSSYGSLFGVPVAVLGSIWFVVALSLVLARRTPPIGENVGGYLFALSTVGLAVVLYLAYASFFVLKAICLLCVATYVAVVGIFIVSGSSTTFPMSALPQRVIRDVRALTGRPAALALVIMFAVAAGSAVAFFPREGGSTGAAASSQADPRSDEFASWYASQPRVDVPVPSDGARVVIVKFNDYQCPACGQTYMNYKPVLAKYAASHPGLVKMDTRDYPLNPACNEHAPGGTFMASCDAAVAVRLARERGRATEMEEWLFANQSSLSPARVRQAARDVGRVENYEGEYARAIAQVRQDAALGARLGVTATPTFFINGVRIPGGLQPPFFDQAIAWELARAE